MNADLAASYALCRRATRRASSNFYLSFLLLPADKRPAMCALYAFLRHVDDAGDSGGSPEQCRERLERCRRELDDALAGAPTDPRWPALADTLRRFDVPRQYLDEAIDGVLMDQTQRRYADFAQLEEYCHRVAVVVGLACLRVWGCRSDAALAPARACGLAFQLTNILRDLCEDLARDRVYLPQDELARFGYGEAELRAAVVDERFGRLMAFQIARAKELYRQAEELPRYLDLDARRALGAMTDTYRGILTRIAAEPGRVFRGRVRLGTLAKLRIALRWRLRGARGLGRSCPAGAVSG